jgi:DNA-3-methyladenine glycosylase
MMLPLSFFQHDDVVGIASQLIGFSLHTLQDGVHSAGIIIETEAYAGVTDRASHAFGGRKTDRTSTMYLSGGHVYIYLCYGMHHLFNIVTADEGIPHAVLIRALLPIKGLEVMKARRGGRSSLSKLCEGPGNLTKAMGISTRHNAMKLSKGVLWLEREVDFPQHHILAGPRIGIDYAGADALLPYRFRLSDQALANQQD